MHTTALNLPAVAARYVTITPLRFTLTDSASGQVVQSGSVTSFVSYSRQGTTVATASAKTDAYRRLMVALADLVTTRLIAGTADWPE